MIADFRSLPIDESRSYLKETKSIDSVLESVIEQYRINKPRLEEVIIKHWDFIVGEDKSHRCSPERIIRGNQLVILVGNNVLRQEMEFDKRQILYRLNRIPECSAINIIRLRCGT